MKVKSVNAEQDSGYKARYLILLSDQTTQRALLFGMDHQYLTEVIDDDDGLVLENLTRFGTACVPPQDIALDARVMAGQPPSAKLRCFALG
ncbi:MAG TPA: hypothetical protein VFL64_17975 [Rhizobacter sp.]|nr:hypothetical protein [Rhizobacter sp.]